MVVTIGSYIYSELQDSHSNMLEMKIRLVLD